MIRGVAYSADPHTGRRDRARIESGSAVALVELAVSAWHVVERTGLLELRDEECVTLARLAVRLEWAVGEGQDPQAVDWAFDGRRFVLGQPQSIAAPRVTIELARGQPVLWSNGNLKDAVAGVPTTASWSFIAAYLRLILYAPIERLGYSVPPGMEVVRRFDGRAYFDITNLQAIYYDALGVLPVEANRTLGGPNGEIELPRPSPERERRWQRARLRALWLLIRQQRLYARAIDQVQRAARAQPLDFSGYSSAQLMDVAERIGQQQTVFGPLFQMGNFDAGAWLPPLEQLLARWFPGRGAQLAAALMAGTGQVTSAAHGYRLAELARVARRDVAAHALLNDPAAFDWQRLPPTSPFKRALARFLDEFGHRTVYEAELANPRWIEDPRFLLAQVRQFLDQGEAPGHADERRAAAERDLQQVAWWARLLAQWLARRARRSAALREAGKSALVAMALPVRFILLEFGRRLVHAGVVDDADDVFHLSRADLEAYVRGEWDGSDFRELVQARRALREARLGGPEPPDLIGAPSVAVAAAGGELRGMAASPGRACGPARLITHPTESARLQRGDVLIAPSTDPAWTPLFLRCSAVVTEVGGFLSHGAIVAREYGLPAVVNVAGVLQLVKDGDQICVDGNRGLVERQLT